MDLEINLDSYNLEELNIVFKNVDNGYCRTESRARCIEKIRIAYEKRIEKILYYFTLKNENLIKDYKLYLFGCQVGNDKFTKIRCVLREWGMCDENGTIFIGIKNIFIDKYRGEYIASNLSEYKDDGLYPLYLELILFIYDIYNRELESKIIFRDIRKRIGGKYLDYIVDYLQAHSFIQLAQSDKQIYIKNEYIYKLLQSDKKNIISEIRSFYDFICEKNNYNNYMDDLFKIAGIQRVRNEWINVSKLDIVNIRNIQLLKECGLIKLYMVEEKVLISLTNISFEILGYMVSKENFEPDNYYIEEQKNIIVMYNDDIFKICNLLMNKKYKLIIRDILLIFNEYHVTN